MIEYLNAIDQNLLLAINGMHCHFLDSFMWLMSGAWAYLVVALGFLYLAYRQGWKQMLLILLALALTITLADQLSSGVIKPLVQRLRPTHDAEIGGLIHLVKGYRAGMYGFVSSHAANSFGAAVLVALLFRHRILVAVIMLWATIVSYSRMYMGVHYPGDIVCGAMIGVVSAYIAYRLFTIASKKWALSTKFSMNDSKFLSIAIIANVSVLLIVASAFDI